MSWRTTIDRLSNAGALVLWLLLTAFVGAGVVLVGVVLTRWVLTSLA
jgi:hypothetical protein